MTSDPQDLRIDLDELREANRLATSFGAALVKAFSSSVIEGRRFEDVLRSIGQRLIDIALKAATKPLESALGSGIESLFSGLSSALPFARGGVISRGLVQPFAQGGVVAAPTYFPLAGGLGLMGERGAEAIMPLARGPDGRLGVRAAGSQGGPVAQVTVNISTNDVESFRRSEAQVSAALARAVARGQRAL